MGNRAKVEVSECLICHVLNTFLSFEAGKMGLDPYELIILKSDLCNPNNADLFRLNKYTLRKITDILTISQLKEIQYHLEHGLCVELAFQNHQVAKFKRLSERLILKLINHCDQSTGSILEFEVEVDESRAPNKNRKPQTKINFEKEFFVEMEI